MKSFLARVRVVLTAAPTYLLTASTVVVVLRDEIAGLFPAAAEDVSRWSVTVLAVLAAAVRIIRRVAPVLPAERGLLPAGGAPGGE